MVSHCTYYVCQLAFQHCLTREKLEDGYVSTRDSQHDLGGKDYNGNGKRRGKLRTEIDFIIV